jgi:ATP-binding cassette subfamily B (MDR/TAP) protein 1
MHRHSRISIIGGLNPSASIQSLDRANKARDSFYQLKEVTTSNVLEEQGDPGVNPSATAQLPIPSLLQLFKILIPMVPSKTGLVVGLALAIGSGICTPMFSNQFSQLLAALGTPGSANVLRIALVLLLIAAIDGLAQWGKFTILHQVNVGWVFKLQKETFRTVIVQDRAWYDDSKNIPVNLVSALVKDANEAREVIGNVAGSLFTVAAMILLGVIWACVAGWQLALVGLAMLPLFVLITALSSHILNKCESVNKQYREECARRFFTAVSNVKAVKAMSLEPVLLEKFENSVAEAYAGGKKAALPTGVGIGLSFFMVYAAQGTRFPQYPGGESI